MTADPFERRTGGNSTPCAPERRVSQQIDRLCGGRKLNDHDGAHRCYEQHGHGGPHRCACAYEWATAQEPP